jgi:hypothetical protein
MNSPLISTKPQPALTIRAGRRAMAHIRDNGLAASEVSLVPGAAGGAKALALSGLDRFIFGHWLPSAPRVRILIGSSIGSWRFACAAQRDPVAALARFADAYIEQRYTARPSLEEITDKSYALLDTLIAGEAEYITSHPHYRLCILTARSKGWIASESRRRLTTALGLAASANLLSRRHLRHFFERVLCIDPRCEAEALFALDDHPTRTVALNADNLRPALFASGAVPLIMRGVTELSGAGAGTFRDGGMVDYHLDLPFARQPGIALYPHFGSRIAPGWFDKALPWRNVSAANLDNVVLIAPSRDYVTRLPFGKIPDRNDFKRFAGRDAERIAYWRTAVAESERLADEFRTLVETGRIADRMLPLS